MNILSEEEIEEYNELYTESREEETEETTAEDICVQERLKTLQREHKSMDFIVSMKSLMKNEQ